MLRLLFAPEELPPPPVVGASPAPEGPGALGLLIAPDPLPPDLPPPPRRGGRWLRWLFAAERLDP